MKPHGVLEDWEIGVRPGANHQIIGKIFNFHGSIIKDGDSFNFVTVTEPPFFKTRIVTSTSGRFYLLGNPLNKEHIL